MGRKEIAKFEMGICSNNEADMPVFSKTVGMVIFLINVFAPGSGTGLAAFLLWFIAQDRSTNQNKFSRFITLYCIAVLQIITTLILVGWIWSIWWGYKLYLKAR